MIMKKIKPTLEDLNNTSVPFRYSTQKYQSIELDKSIDYPKIIVYAINAYNQIVSNLANWQLNRECFNTTRSITHSYYDGVHSNSIDTGLISKLAADRKKKDPKFLATKDHIYVPQSMVRMVLDKPQKYLTDPNDFFKLFYKSCQTREVTKEENDMLSKCVKSGKVENGKKYDKIQILCPLFQRYNYCGIVIFKREGGRGWYYKDMPIVDATIDTPKGYDEYESQFIVEEFE